MPSVEYGKNNVKQLFEQLDYDVNEEFNISELEDYVMAQNIQDNIYDTHKLESSNIITTPEVELTGPELFNKDIIFRDNEGDEKTTWSEGRHNVWDEDSGDDSDYYRNFKIHLSKVQFQYEMTDAYVNTPFVYSTGEKIETLLSTGKIKSFKARFNTVADKYWEHWYYSRNILN